MENAEKITDGRIFDSITQVLKKTKKSVYNDEVMTLLREFKLNDGESMIYAKRDWRNRQRFLAAANSLLLMNGLAYQIKKTQTKYFFALYHLKI